MLRFLLAAFALTSMFLIETGAFAADNNGKGAADKKPLGKAPDAKSFMQKFDKNQDGVLTKDELPEFLAKGFEKADRNGDGKLDMDEVEKMLTHMRERNKPGQDNPEGKKPGAGNPEGKKIDPERIVADVLGRMDANKDGKISKDEAQGFIKEYFDKIDGNKDGFVDKDELTQAAKRMAAGQGGRPGKQGKPEEGGQKKGPDFNDFDKDADGRITKEEAKGTPLEDKFDAMDANKDGRIDRKEFEAFLKKGAEKQKPND